MFTAMESKGILRTAPEEYQLAPGHKRHDPLAAEFIRTVRHEFFFGRVYVKLFESFLHNEETRESQVVFRRDTKQVVATDEESIYGYRPTHPNTWFLSP